MKTIFFGTPAIAVPFLENLTRAARVDAVITSPDQPSGRGYEVKAPEVKSAALELKVPVYQPETLKDPAFQAALRSLAPDVGIVVAYGKLLPSAVLEIPKHGMLNVHFSLLPKYRGAAPIQWALINGETETGVTLFWLDPGMDTGPIFLQERISITPEDDAESLRNKLVPLGVRMMADAIQRLSQGKKTAQPQAGPDSKAPLLNKEDGAIDWTLPARAILNRIRGLTPWPGAFTQFPHAGKPVRLKVLRATLRSDGKAGEPGRVASVETGVGFVIECGQGSLEIIHVQPEGKRPMAAWDFWQGSRLKQGDILG